MGYLLVPRFCDDFRIVRREENSPRLYVHAIVLLLVVPVADPLHVLLDRMECCFSPYFVRSSNVNTKKKKDGTRPLNCRFKNASLKS